MGHGLIYIYNRSFFHVFVLLFYYLRICVVYYYLSFLCSTLSSSLLRIIIAMPMAIIIAG
jgi:hypothetical protein